MPAKSEGEYVRKSKHHGKTAESEARRKSGLRNAPPAPALNNRNLGAGNRSKQPWTLPGAELSEQRVLEMIGAPQWIEQQDAVTVGLLVGTVQRIDHCEKYLAEHPGMGMAKRQSLLRDLDRFTRTAAELADKLALSPDGRVRLGLAVAKTKAVQVKPVRTRERAVQVAALLDSCGILPPPPEPVDAEVVEHDPAPLSAQAMRDLGIRPNHNNPRR